MDCGLVKSLFMIMVFTIYHGQCGLSKGKRKTRLSEQDNLVSILVNMTYELARNAADSANATRTHRLHHLDAAWMKSLAGLHHSLESTAPTGGLKNALGKTALAGRLKNLLRNATALD